MHSMQSLQRQVEDEGSITALIEYDDDNLLPVPYDPDHAAFIQATRGMGDKSVPAYAELHEDVESVEDETIDSSVLKPVSYFQERRDERPQIRTTRAHIADYTIINEDRHPEILETLRKHVGGVDWLDEKTEEGHPSVDWDVVYQRAADTDLSDARIRHLQSRYEEPVEQHLSMTLVPDGGIWSASGDYLALRQDGSKPCAYSIETDQPIYDVVDGAVDESVPEEFDVENAVQLRIVRIPTDAEKPTSLTPQLFEDLEEDMTVTVRGSYSDDLSMDDVDPERPLVLMGTGSGGVPVNRIADTVLESDMEEPVYLYQTAKYMDHFLHRERLERAGELRENFYPVFAATRESSVNPDYGGPSDYPQHGLLKQVDPETDANTWLLSDEEQSYLTSDPDPGMPTVNPEEPVFLACGNNYFGKDLDRILDALYVDEHNRHMEIFGG